MSLEKHQRIGINVLYHSSPNFSSLLELSFLKGLYSGVGCMHKVMREMYMKNYFGQGFRKRAPNKRENGDFCCLVGKVLETRTLNLS